MDGTRRTTTIGIKKITKNNLDKRRAPGQAYDGFLRQMMELWDKHNDSYDTYPTGKGRGDLEQ
jgi:hypothetical protein